MIKDWLGAGRVKFHSPLSIRTSGVLLRNYENNIKYHIFVLNPAITLWEYERHLHTLTPHRAQTSNRNYVKVGASDLVSYTKYSDQILFYTLKVQSINTDNSDKCRGKIRCRMQNND
ncbi:CLUMA_CG000628, isoform A [Clunio marinus]|uniref:CLUMA_CG000628, isoform A n=1 Tax=Clunio marinus TaxID=568069 RepID=A0A1J1HFK2_9DIPT|nr:CLUMA_CG000628, isoform A [Clunio marinus]